MSTVQTPAARGTTEIATRVRDLIGYVQQGPIIDAIYEFYAPDVRMQENNNAPTVGLEANVERERKFVQGVREWKRFDVESVGVDADRGRAFIQSVAEFVGVDGNTYRTDQVAVQTWRDGKVVEEKFYYDT